MKKQRYTAILLLVLAMLLFPSCLLAVMGNQNLCIDSAEYEDSTHFLLYFSGSESDSGLPDKDSLIVSDQYDSNAVPTHQVVDVERNWWDVLMGGYLYRCEVSPAFRPGEKVFVRVNPKSYYADISGSAEFTVPR